MSKRVATATGLSERDGDEAQRLLPPECRGSWAVVPRQFLGRVFVAGLLLGAGAAFTAAGFLADEAWMRWGFAVGLALAYLMNRLVPVKANTLPRELRGYEEEPG